MFLWILKNQDHVWFVEKLWNEMIILIELQLFCLARVYS
jgi:hypothetical protein